MTEAVQVSRAATTRAGLLDAAREVFSTSGFTEASIAEVVARAGASVGSLYHHFGGKADLYLALYDRYEDRQEQLAAEAVHQARLAGITDPLALFLEGSRGYLRGCWEQRDLARLFLAGGGPPGFDLIVRRRHREWARQNHVLLASAEDELADALVLVLTTVLGEAGREVALAENEQVAWRLAEDVLRLVARVGRD